MSIQNQEGKGQKMSTAAHEIEPDGTINTYFLRHGTDGLRALAKRADTKLSYLLQLNYSTSKRPSIEMAQCLIEAGDGELSFEGLANPKKVLVREVRKDQKDRAEG